jgi:hypothetical protein
MHDSEDTEFEFADDATEFEPCPWGSRQRVKPRATFKTAPAPVAHAALEVPSLPIAIAIAATPPFVAWNPVAVRGERDIATWRVPRVAVLTPKPSPLRRRLAVIALPLGALALGGVLALVFARPAAPHLASASLLQARSPEPIDDEVYIVTNIEQPPAPSALPSSPAPPTHKHTARAIKRPALAFDTATPLGDLAHHRRR